MAMGFKYLILLQGKIYSNKNQDDEMLGLFVFSKIIVCKDDDFSAFRATKFINETLGNVLGCTLGLHGMGLIVATIQQVLIWFQHEWD